MKNYCQSMEPAVRTSSQASDGTRNHHGIGGYGIRALGYELCSSKEIPAFGDVFDALPFMPVVSLDAKTQPADYLPIPMDGLLMGLPNHPLSLVKRVQEAMRTICRRKGR